MTPSEIKALEAVKAGKVECVYRTKGSVMRGPASARILWRLRIDCLIADAPRSGAKGAFEIRCPQVLTGKGIAALSAGK